MVTIAICNGKGGTGKTSATANLGGLLAAGGLHVLLVDIDPQGNLVDDLGYTTDEGQALARALVFPTDPLRPVSTGRERLEAVPGGPELNVVAEAWRSLGDQPERRLRDLLAPMTHDVVLIDCPPGNERLQELAMVASDYVAIPLRLDESSRRGLVRVAEIYHRVRSGPNPALTVLCAWLFEVPSNASTLREQAQQALREDVGEDVPVLQASIRSAHRPSVVARRRKALIHELAVAPRVRHYESGYDPLLDPGDATGLAGDYRLLAEELIGAVAPVQV